jgi:hypothetical protein
MLKLFSSILWEAFQWVALLGGALGLITGVMLIVNSAALFRIAERMNTWVSTRQAMRPLDEPITIERGVYRWHRVIGMLIVAGALYTLYVLVLRLKGPEMIWMLTSLFRTSVAGWFAESLRVFLVVVNFAAVLIGIVMVARPSALKRLEAWANRSYSARQATRPWEIPRGGPDRLVQAHPRLTGAVLAVAGAYILGAIAWARFL